MEAHFTQLVCIKVAGCLISLSRMKQLVSASLFKIIVYFFELQQRWIFFFVSDPLILSFIPLILSEKIDAETMIIAF